MVLLLTGRFDYPKLVLKQRNGANITKIYDTATTPHHRAIGHEKMRKRASIQMNEQFERIKPGALSGQILALTGELETMARPSAPPSANTP